MMSSGSSTLTASSSSQPIVSPLLLKRVMHSDQDDESYLIVPLIFNMPAAIIAAIRQCIRNVTLPTWVGRPPVNLGEASHGKLKANDYLVLFSFSTPRGAGILAQTREIRGRASAFAKLRRPSRMHQHCMFLQDLKCRCGLVHASLQGISAISTQTLPLLGPEAE